MRSRRSAGVGAVLVAVSGDCSRIAGTIRIPHRRALRRRGIEPVIARRGTGHGSGLGVYRWVVERTLSWLHGFRKLRLRTDRTGAFHHAFVMLACAIICFRFLMAGSFC